MAGPLTTFDLAHRAADAGIELPRGMRFAGESGAFVRAGASRNLEDPPSQPIGSESESWYGDILATLDREDAQELAPPDRFHVFDQMKRSEPMVRALAWAVKLPIMAAQWKVEPGNGGREPIDRLAADLIAWHFGLNQYADRARPAGILGGWLGVLREALCFLDYGCMTHEREWAPIEVWRDEDGDEHRIRPLDALSPRWPHTIAEFGPPTRPERRAGQTLGDTRQVFTERPMRGRDLVHRVHESEGSRFYGVSLYRPAWGPWKIKRAVLVAGAVGFDRAAIGIPHVRYPPNASEADKSKARQIGRDLRGHERAYVATPNSAEAGKGWQIDLLNLASTLADPVPFVRYLDEQIASTGLAMFTRLGMTDQGARAVAEPLAEPFYLALNAIAHGVAADTDRQVSAEVIRVNIPGGDRIAVPRLVPSQVIQRNVETLIAAVRELSVAGHNLRDRPTQNAMRRVLDLPALPEGEEVPEGEDELGPFSPAEERALRRLAAKVGAE